MCVPPSVSWVPAAVSTAMSVFVGTRISGAESAPSTSAMMGLAALGVTPAKESGALGKPDITIPLPLIA